VSKRVFRLLRSASRRLAPPTPAKGKSGALGAPAFDAFDAAAAAPPAYVPILKRAYCRRQRVVLLVFGAGADALEDWVDGAVDARPLELAVFGELFPKSLSEIRENDFETALHRVFAERKFLAATIASFSDVNAIVKKIAEAIWGLIALFLTLMLWKASWDAVIGPASILLGVSFAFGGSCAQVVAGVSYVLFTAPYDIGDRVIVKEIRDVDAGAPPLTVQAIGPMMTTFVTSFGETVSVANHLLATKALINHTRSPSPFLRVSISLATRTAPAEVSKLYEALKQYVRDHRGEWNVAYLYWSAVNHEKGEILLDAWMGAANPYHDWDSVYGAKSRVHVWLHQYIYEAGLHFVKPTQPYAGADALPLKLQKGEVEILEARDEYPPHL